MELIPISLTGLPPDLIIPVLLIYAIVAAIKAYSAGDKRD